MKQIIPESMWLSLSKFTSPSECHCKCGETFVSLAYYIGRKTRSLSQQSCPSCGSIEMDYVLPKEEAKRDMPNLFFKIDSKRMKFNL